MRVLKKKVIERNVLDLARERIALIFDRFDHVAVSFSGGKDSTVCLNLALEEATRLGRLPLDVFFWDEEAIHDQTIEYVTRVAENPDVAFRWLCQPIEHRNACSRREPYWYPWDPTKQELWCRPLPPRAIHDPAFPRIPVPKANHLLFPTSLGSVAVIVGLRADESIRRFMAVSNRETDNYISVDPEAKHVSLVKPIYDWTSGDVWAAPKAFGWDYNRTYDLFNKAGVPLNTQRVCPPYGEEPMQALWLYGLCWPELWERMLKRVAGAATAGRYSRSPLYAMGTRPTPPPGMTYQEAINVALDKWPTPQALKISARIKNEMDRHRRQSKGAPIPEVSAVGLSWQFLYMVAIRGDLKGRKKFILDRDFVEGAEGKIAPNGEEAAPD